jgi:DUF4097 and DUF4098 domain-containing protein YvlB
MRVKLSLLGILAAQSVASAASAPSAYRDQVVPISGPLTALELSAVSGDIHVAAGPTYSGTVKITAFASTKEEAEAILKEAKLETTFSAGRLRVRAGFPDERGRKGVRLETHFEMTAPPGTEVKADLVDGNTKVEGMTGPLEVRAVNGNVVASGMTHGVHLSSVNGSVEGHLGAVIAGSEVQADTVNGPLVLWFPPSLGLRLSAHTLNGEILSTLPFAARTEARRFGPVFNKHYSGTVGGGEVSVKMHSVNGRVAICAAGTTVDKAKPLVVVTGDGRDFPFGPGSRVRSPPIPPIPPIPALPPLPPTAPNLTPEQRKRWDEQRMRWDEQQRRWDEQQRRLAHARHDVDDGDDVRRDKVTGDLDVERSVADVSVEAITGKLRVRTRSGDVRVGSVGGSAQIDTKGGNVHVHRAAGEVSAQSGGGDLRIDSATGNVHLETKGGDIRVGSCGGSVVARTKAGDIMAKQVRGGIKAETDGGDIVVEVVGKPSAGGVELTTHGGDVSLTIPRNFDASITLQVDQADDEGRYIVSEFPEVTVTRGHHGHSATGKIGKGTASVLVRTRSGTVTLKKGPPL